jgi:threonine dehydratase
VDSISTRPLRAAAIRAAYRAVPAEFRDSPQFVSDPLSVRAGRPVLVKMETLNPIRSFKGRGTWLAVAGLVREGAISSGHGVATESTGNFGQGVAYAARGHRVPAAIVVPEGANPLKVNAIRRLGARVLEVARAADAHAALSLLTAEGFHILRDGHDDRVAIGAGTMALEVTDGIRRGDLPQVATAFVPIGDGSLIAGIGTWLRGRSPGTRVVGVQVESAPAMARSWRSGRVETVAPGPTRADGLASGSGNAELLPTLRRIVDDMILISETALMDAQRELFAVLGVTAEASAAASWAAALESGDDGACLVIVTGSNAWPGDFTGSAETG